MTGQIRTPRPSAAAEERRPLLWCCAGAAGLALVLASAGSGLAAELPGPERGSVSVPETEVSPSVRQMMAWILETADNQGLPFVIIDKVGAQVLAYNPDGRLLGTAPVLLGLARGDISPPGIGNRPLSAIAPDDRITPAGRFLASIGENASGKGVLWIDYDGALSLHPVVTTRASDRRLERLYTPTAEDNRISYGCVNVPAEFYEEVVESAFEGTVGVVYILPERLSITEVFFDSAVVRADAEIAAVSQRTGGAVSRNGA